MAKLRIDTEGVKHIRGASHNTFETVCGYCDTGTQYDDEQEGTPDCISCIIGAQDLLKYASAKEIKSWNWRGGRN